MKLRRAVAAVLLALAPGIAACGSDKPLHEGGDAASAPPTPASWGAQRAAAFARDAAATTSVEAPDCGRPVPADRVTVTADRGGSVAWCLGQAGTDLAFKVVNARTTFVSVQYPTRWGVPRAADGVATGAAVDRFFATQASAVAARRGSALVLLAPGATLRLGLPAESSGAVKVTFGPTALMSTMAQLGTTLYAEAAEAADVDVAADGWSSVEAALAGHGDPAMRPRAKTCRTALAPLVGQPLDEAHTRSVARAVLGCAPGLVDGADTPPDASVAALYAAATTAVVDGLTGGEGTWQKASLVAPDRSFDIALTAHRLELADLRAASIPASCGHGAATLVGGSRDWGHDGSADLVLAAGGGKSPVLTDLTGDGRRDAAVVLDCNAGGVGWPEWLLLYGPGPELLGGIDLGKATPAEHSDLTSFRPSGDGLALAWQSYEGAGFQIRKWTGHAAWTGGSWKLSGVTEDRSFARCNHDLEAAVQAEWPSYVVQVERCDGQWAYIGDAMGMGDTEQMWHYTAGRWTRFTSFPTTYCTSDLRAMGAPAWVVEKFAYRGC